MSECAPQAQDILVEGSKFEAVHFGHKSGVVLDSFLQLTSNEFVTEIQLRWKRFDQQFTIPQSPAVNLQVHSQCGE